MSNFRKLTENMLASPQITLADLEEAKALGVSTVICNRPDDEEPGQLNVSEIESAASSLEMDFVHIPITHAGFSEPQIEAMQAALDGAAGSVLAYCRSGTRSTLLWSLAQAASGRAPDEVAAAAASAGYDVSPVRPAMDMLASRASG